MLDVSLANSKIIKDRSGRHTLPALFLGVRMSKLKHRVANLLHLERLLQPPVPASAATLPVVAAATGCQLKFFAKAIHGNLSQQFGCKEMDLSCAHVPSNAPSHRYFTSKKQVICFKTLHANPGAI